MTTGQHNAGKPTPNPQSPPAVTKSRRTKPPLDRTQLWVAGIGAGGAIVAAGIAAVSAFAAGWLHYSGPGTAPQPAHTQAITASSRVSKPLTPTAVSTSATTPEQTTTTFYLANESSVTSSGNPPESGTWAMKGTTYTHSIGYPDLCISEVTTFALNGSYSNFIAMVGVADTADSNDRSTTVTFEVDDGSGNQLGSKTAQYGQPQVINVPVQGISSLTLQTSNGDCFGSNSSVAVWGNARVVRLQMKSMPSQHRIRASTKGCWSSVDRLCVGFQTKPNGNARA
jgi:hypothetical protein